MNKIIFINDIIFSGIIGGVVAKINNWNIFLVSGIYMFGSYLFNISSFNKIINKLLKY
jgi:hypothetical protein